MYNTLSADYDRFVNWQSRLDFELPFITKELDSPGIHPHLLDAACGTGIHTIALAKLGYQAAGADLSAGMIARARENAREQAIDVPFYVAGFKELERNFCADPRFPFDAVICLGNSLPHLLTQEDESAALEDFSACLRPDGLLILQNRNFDAVMEKRNRWMDPQSYTEGDQEWIFYRFYDFEPSGLITFNMITLKRAGTKAWEQQISSSQLLPLLHDDLIQQLEAAGFQHIKAYGSLGGDAYKKLESGNLVITAHRI